MSAASTEQALPNPIWTSPRRWWVLAVMSLSIMMMFIDLSVVNTALPTISRELGASTSTLQWVVNSYSLVLASLLLVGGTIGDRFGRRRWMIVGMALFGGAAVGASLSTNVGMLIAFRGLQGIGAALVMPATLSIITYVFRRAERAKAIGIWTGVGGLGIGLGPVIGGYLVDEISWAAVFWMQVPVVALALAGLIAIVPGSRASRERSLDVPGAALATVGLLALVYGIIQGGEAGWSSAEILGAFGVAAIALSAFAVVETRVEEPMLPLRFFRQRDFAGGVVIIGLVFFSVVVTFFFLTQFFQLVQGRRAFEAGSLIVVPAIGMMVGAPISGIAVKRFGPRALNVAALSAMIGGTLLLTQLEVGTSTLQIIVALFGFGVGGGLGLAPLTDTVMAAVPVDDAGIGSAVNDVSRELGAALGIAIIGSLVNSVYRSNVASELAGVVPAQLVEVARDGVGITAVVAASLPAETATALTTATSAAFVDAIAVGLYASIGFLMLRVAAALALLPSKMRETQVGYAEETPALELAPLEAPAGAAPVPVGVPAGAAPVRVEVPAGAAPVPVEVERW